MDDTTLTIMIRLFISICKAFHIIKALSPYKDRQMNDYEALSSMMASLDPAGLPPCPHCGAPAASYSRNGSYERHLVCCTDGSVCDRRVSIPCVRCRSCGISHALLFSVIIPYSSYSLGFLICLLYARLTRQPASVAALCSRFDISESTFYRIRKRLLQDERALLCALRSFLETADLLAALYSCQPYTLHGALSLFFCSTGYSFLQPCIKIRPKGPSLFPSPGSGQIS